MKILDHHDRRFPCRDPSGSIVDSIIWAYARISPGADGVLGLAGVPSLPGVAALATGVATGRGGVGTDATGDGGEGCAFDTSAAATEKSDVSRSRRARVFRDLGCITTRFWRAA
ncbi:MAG TPA: hypothetical protein VN717_01710, partial [Gemmatimonadaceae bacterium]|nr:hypothetical protein [Gemmatimonadaceae bacterium]